MILLFSFLILFDSISFLVNIGKEKSLQGFRRYILYFYLGQRRAIPIEYIYPRTCCTTKPPEGTYTDFMLNFIDQSSPALALCH